MSFVCCLQCSTLWRLYLISYKSSWNALSLSKKNPVGFWWPMENQDIGNCHFYTGSIWSYTVTSERTLPLITLFFQIICTVKSHWLKLLRKGHYRPGQRCSGLACGIIWALLQIQVLPVHWLSRSKAGNLYCGSLFRMAISEEIFV